ncbi:alpha/beta fold hydrolase [Actinomadura macra]|uniref:alpha/beta fold hydrolase n=1 Tax=Actinomadura macra TaxID=46164 RepID=UPI00082CE6C6|nr:alpha/beta hydrolase [Actinomadura macra]
MPEITARGVRFHVQTMDPDVPPVASPPVMVFVHGLVMDNLSSFYYTIAGPMAAAGARCVLYDQRGHGRTERPPTGYGPADAVADLFAILDELGHRAPVFLVAHSWGGVVALNAALADPSRIAGLVLIEGCGPSEHPGQWTEKLLNSLGRISLVLEHDRPAERRLAFGWRRDSKAAANGDALVNGTTLLDDVAVAAPVRIADLSTIACPLLAIYGQHSDVVDAGLLLRSVPGCTLHIMAGHAHTILREGTAELLEVLLPWMARHAGTSAPVVEGAR